MGTSKARQKGPHVHFKLDHEKPAPPPRTSSARKHDGSLDSNGSRQEVKQCDNFHLDSPHYHNNHTDNVSTRKPDVLENQAGLSDVGTGSFTGHTSVSTDSFCDDASATSGSYVVDPDDLCREIDHLFFSDTL